MTLREWCQQEGHPLATIVMAAEGSAPSQRMERRGLACVCGQRADFERDGKTPGYRVLPARAVDATGPDRA